MLITDEGVTWRQKVKNYFSDAWNRIDQVMYGVLILAIVLRYTLTDDISFEWARNVYAVDLVMFYLRILQFYFVEKRLGPKVIMIRRMVADLMLFILLVVVFLLAYGVAAQSLLYPNSAPTWDILYNVVYHPYFSMYQEFPLDQLEGNVEGCSDNSTVYLNDPTVPRCSRKSWLAMTMFCVYILITSIMLINLLIAIFSNTFQTVEDIGIKTWSFYRYNLTKEYHDKPTLAPPLIILNHIWRIIVYVYTSCGNSWENEDDFKQTLDRELQKRLTAFERAGVENYLHWKRCEEDDKIDKKADNMLQKLDQLAVTVENAKKPRDDDLKSQEMDGMAMNVDQLPQREPRSSISTSPQGSVTAESGTEVNPPKSKSHDHRHDYHRTKKRLSDIRKRLESLETIVQQHVQQQNDNMKRISDILQQQYHAVRTDNPAQRTAKLDNGHSNESHA